MKKSLLLALAMLTPVAAFAAAGTPGAYVQGVMGGNAVFSNNDYSFGNDTATGFSFGAATGYLWGCDAVNYGVELGGLLYPRTTTSNRAIPGTNINSNFSVNGYNVDLLGVLKYNFPSGFNVFAKGGVAYVNQKVSLNALGSSSTTVSLNKTDDTFAPEAAIGVGYQLNQNWDVNLTVNTVFAGEYKADHVVARNGNVLLGATYHFA